MTFSLVSVLILVMSIGVKLWLALFNRSLGKRIQSTVMMATAADALDDDDHLSNHSFRDHLWCDRLESGWIFWSGSVGVWL